MSVAAIWVLNRSPNNFNAVAVGWHVSLNLYIIIILLLS
jgi:hypothetical protein